ncbi:MAG: transporter [Betaproteobacteria bacterium]|nr:transporter [Betaproteobacteria bacterium]
MHAMFDSAALIQRRLFGSFVGALVSCCPHAYADNFPERPVRIVVANPPGGTADLVGRMIAKKLSEMWKQTAVVDNRAGGAGVIGTDLVAKATPNGYTLLVSAPGPITTGTLLQEKLPYDVVKDLTPITLLAFTPSVLLVHPTVPAKSVAELIALAKSKPGKLNYASSGQGNPSHLQGAMLARFAGIDIVHIPYKGGGIALADILGGHVEIFFNAIPAMLPSVQANRLRALAVTSPRRFAGLPDVPTMTEAGFPQIGSTVWYGALAPPKLPATLLKTLHTEFVGALAAPDLRDALVSGGSDIVGNSPQQFAEFLKKETESARELLKLSGAKRDF